MATSDIAKITARVNWIIGSRGANFDATVADDRFIQEELRRAIIETEAELVRALAESNHPKKESFMAWSSDLTNGSTIPAHIGQVDAIQIKLHTAASTYEQAEATSRENIRMWRANPSGVFGAVAHDASGSPLAGYYNLTNSILTFTGYRAQARICNYVPNYATPALQVDDQFDSILVAGTIPRLNKIGVPQALVATYGQLYVSLMSLIRQGVMDMPDLLEAQKHE